MSLQEAKKRLTTIITTKFNNDYSIDSTDKEAIEKVLNELDKRIPAERIEEIIKKNINKLKSERDDNLDYASDYDYEICLWGQIEKELLNKE